jgi:hypothetical protein
VFLAGNIHIFFIYYTRGGPLKKKKI